jgi:hypothetical protein
MVRFRQLFGLSGLVCLLIFGFQNCGMQFEEDLASTSDDGSSGLTFNSDGTFNIPLNMNQNGGSSSGGSSGSSSGGGGDINLGSGGSGGGGLGSTGSGSGGTTNPYNPYEDNYSSNSLYPATPTDGGVMGKKLYYFNNLGTLDLGGHMNGAMVWQSYSSAVSSWASQQPGSHERSTLLAMSFQKLSSDATKTTYFLDGTSICYHFSANVSLPNTLQSYGWTERTGGHDGTDNYYSISGYQAAVSAITIVKKTDEEMTMLEGAACQTMGSYDSKVISAFFNVFKQYPILTPSGSNFALRSASRWNISAALVPF